ncbi:MAG: hypothetical protein ACREID_04530, partial [Planctomycetota bacterium]
MKTHWLAAAFAVIPVLGATAAPISLGPWHKDESNGFKIKLPAKWDQVPTKFQEVSVLGKWCGKPKKGAILPEGQVLRFLRRAAETAWDSAAPTLPGRGIPGQDETLGDQPKDLWSHIEQFGMGWDIESDADFKPASKNLRGEFRIYREKLEGARVGGREVDNYRRLVAAAQVEDAAGGPIFGVFYTCAVSDEKNMLGAFRQSLKNFRILVPDEEEEAEEGDEAPDVTDADIFVDSETKPEAWREARRKKLV